MSISLNQKLALLAFLLSLLAMIVSLIAPHTSEEKKMPGIIFIDQIELATYIKDKKPIQLIDVRAESEFQQFHIPSANHIPLRILLEADLEPTQRTVIYSADDQLANQAYYMLRGMEFSNLHVLRGGVNDWYDRILYPKIPLRVPKLDKTLTDQIKSLSLFYGGRAQFVNDTTVLNYYKGTGALKKSTEKPALVRMGC